jgi:hypothetical protein
MDLVHRRILVYKRTHTGDPDRNGRFGIYDCMGRVRNYPFDAVIGVGGLGQEPRSYGIDRKINWVGINPKRISAPDNATVIVTFQHFLLLDKDGPLLETLAPNLARRLYEQGARFIFNSYNEVEHLEAQHILEWSRDQTAHETGALESTSGCQLKCRPVVKSNNQ